MSDKEIDKNLIKDDVIISENPDELDISDENNTEFNEEQSDYSASYVPAVQNKNDLLYFLKQVNKYPILTEEEEKDLALRYYNNADLSAAHTLVTCHLRMVVKLAYQYRGYGLPISDMISEGSIGLMKAVKKFDPNKGFRFSTYALWWIKAQINEFVLNSWSIVKIGTTAAQKKLFFNLRKLKEKLNILTDRDLTNDETKLIANDLGVTSSEVTDMNQRMSGGYDLSLNTTYGDDTGTEHIDNLASEELNSEELLIKNDYESFSKKVIMEAIATLKDREKEIIQARKLTDKPMLLDELGAKYGISKERVRQIEENALKKIKQYIEKQHKNYLNHG